MIGTDRDNAVIFWGNSFNIYFQYENFRRVFYKNTWEMGSRGCSAMPVSSRFTWAWERGLSGWWWTPFARLFCYKRYRLIRYLHPFDFLIESYRKVSSTRSLNVRLFFYQRLINLDSVYARYYFSSADTLIGASIVERPRARMRISSIIGVLWLSTAVSTILKLFWLWRHGKCVHGVSIYWNEIFFWR